MVLNLHAFVPALIKFNCVHVYIHQLWGNNNKALQTKIKQENQNEEGNKINMTPNAYPTLHSFYPHWILCLNLQLQNIYQDNKDQRGQKRRESASHKDLWLTKLITYTQKFQIPKWWQILHNANSIRLNPQLEQTNKSTTQRIARHLLLNRFTS